MGRLYRSDLTGRKLKGSALYVLFSDWREEGHTITGNGDVYTVTFLTGRVVTYIRVR